MVLAAAGAVLGILVAYLSLSAFLALAPPELPRVAQIAIERTRLGFAASAAVTVAVLFGVLPGWQLTTIEPAEVLRARRRRRRLGNARILAASWPRSGTDSGCHARAVHRRTAGEKLESIAAVAILGSPRAMSCSPTSPFLLPVMLTHPHSSARWCAWPPTQRRCRASATPARLSRLHLLAPEGSTPRCSPKDRRSTRPPVPW